MATTRRLAAILAADVAGYSRLKGADDEGTHELLKAHPREPRSEDQKAQLPYRRKYRRRPADGIAECCGGDALRGRNAEGDT
jgi:hypothetical protein